MQPPLDLPPGARRLDAGLVHFESIGSTNAWLAANAALLADESWVHADAQTSGRGRHGRQWHSAPGNLFASVLVRAQPGEGPAAELAFVAALALLAAAEPYAKTAQLSLKWPNDLLANGVKCAGILCEHLGGTTIIGFGLNLASAPAGLDRPVTALGTEAPPAAILKDLRACFTAERASWRRDGFDQVRPRWLARATPPGQPTTVTIGSDTRSGRFAGLAPDGALLLDRDGRIETIYAGDVWEK